MIDLLKFVYRKRQYKQKNPYPLLPSLDGFILFFYFYFFPCKKYKEFPFSAVRVWNILELPIEFLKVAYV